MELTKTVYSFLSENGSKSDQFFYLSEKLWSGSPTVDDYLKKILI